MAPEMSEAWDVTDNWAGVTDPAERRRRQNRLHQRAYRKKRHLQRLALVQAAADMQLVPTRSAPSQDADSVQNMPLFHLLRCAGVREQAMLFMQSALAHWSGRIPVPRDLASLTRLNAFDALARNALVLGISVESLESDDGDSPFTRHGPQPLAHMDGTPRAFPSHLTPTALQRTVRHHPWLDLFPMPRMRDNILRGIQEGRLDEDELCNELVCDLVNLETSSAASLVIWGDAWEMEQWEFSPDFWTKWGMLLQGCDEVLQATNSWRAKRGESRVEVVLG